LFNGVEIKRKHQPSISKSERRLLMKKNFGWIQASFAAISLVILGCGFFIENTLKKD